MITSSSNALIKRINLLNTRARARREQSCFVAEGIKLFRETPPEKREAVLVSESFSAAEKDLLEGVAYEVAEDGLFQRICDTRTPQGILTIAKMPEYAPEELLGPAGKEPLLLVLEDVQDPGNVGTMIRTAEGAGVTGILLSGKTADPFQPKVIRSTMGSIYRVPLRREADLTQAVSRLKERGIRIVASHLEGNARFGREDYRRGTAFLIGNEGNGLSDALSSLADVRVKIPMEGQVESLNAAVAAALLMYAAHEQRAERPEE